jgi:hypothetical protein
MTGEMIEEGIADDVDQSRRWARIGARIAEKAGRAEALFVGLLRYAALVIAALVLLVAVILLGLGAARQLGRTQVEPDAVAVGVEDVVPSPAEAAKAVVATAPPKLGVGEQIRKQTLDIYRSRFKAYERPDTKLTEKEVVDFVWTPDRIKEFAELDGTQLLDREGKPLGGRDAIIGDALHVVDTAAQFEAFRKQLAAYRNATKVKVCADQRRTRTRTVSGWDPYSTNCSNWFVTPIGCSATREINEPYTENVCEMKFPADLEAPAQQFASAIQSYLFRADMRLLTARIVAEEQTIVDSGKLIVGFLILMFLYLFVAMERHHRNLRALVERREHSPRAE